VIFQRSREPNTFEGLRTQPQSSTPRLANTWMLALALCTLSPQVRANNAEQTMRQLENSLVTVEVKTTASDIRVGQGTGFAVINKRHLITSYHVVSDVVLEPHKYTLNLKTADAHTISASVVMIDVVADIALLRTNTDIGLPLKLQPKWPRKGGQGYALGNPGGMGQTVVSGIFNGLVSGSPIPMLHFTGAINGGMSGGPAVNQRGEVIGVNTSSMRGDQLVGFLSASVNIVNMLEREADSLAPTAQELQAIVVSQAGDFSSWVANKATAEPPDTKTSLSYKLPDKFGSYGKCSGQLQDDADKRYQVLGKRCTLDNDVYINSDTRIGNISIDQRIVFSDQLNAAQIATALDFEVNSRFDYTGDKLDGKSHWQCKQHRVQLQANIKGMFHTCARSLAALPGLNDYWFLFVESPSGSSGLISSVYFTGFKLPDTKRVLAHLLANVQRKEQP
jgi:serine protease Do